MVRAYLGIGSNIGDKQGNCEKAVELLREEKGIEVTSRSSFYQTRPVGGPPQEDFINGTVEIETSLSPEELLEALKDMEKRMGRGPAGKDHPRIIDLDILLYGALVARSVVKGKGQEEKREEYARICMDISKDDFLNVMDHALTYDSVPELKKIACETLVIYGENDRIPRMQSEIFVDNIPRSRRVEIANAAHVINYERPDEFNRILDDFISEGVS